MSPRIRATPAIGVDAQRHKHYMLLEVKPIEHEDLEVDSLERLREEQLFGRTSDSDPKMIVFTNPIYHEFVLQNNSSKTISLG
jgi:hypothetical protein